MDIAPIHGEIALVGLKIGLYIKLLLILLNSTNMFKCHICYSYIDRYHTVWLPERAVTEKNQVYPICFNCSDKFCYVITKGILKYLRLRTIDIKYNFSNTLTC